MTVFLISGRETFSGTEQNSRKVVTHLDVAYEVWSSSVYNIGIYSTMAGTEIVPSKSLSMNAVLPHGNKQHLNLSTDSVQLNGKLRLGGRTGKNAGRLRAGV